MRCDMRLAAQQGLRQKPVQVGGQVSVNAATIKCLSPPISQPLIQPSSNPTLLTRRLPVVRDLRREEGVQGQPLLARHVAQAVRRLVQEGPRLQLTRRVDVLESGGGDVWVWEWGWGG